jgi:DNA polymerase-1
MNNIALIDGDSILYKVGFALEEELEDEEGNITYNVDLINAKDYIDGLIDGILFNTSCDSLELWLGETGTNFRFALASEYLDHDYKHNRKETRKPDKYNEMLEYIKKQYKSKSSKDCEVDDAVCYKLAESPDKYTLCAIDKDVLYQSVGKHYNYGKDEWVTVTNYEAIYYAYLQTLTGDPTDGYKGCPNIGPVKAKKLLGEPGEHSERVLWAKILLAYRTAYHKQNRTTKEARMAALTTMRLANMHQLKRNYKGKLRIVLWEPVAKGSEVIDTLPF